MQPLRGIVTPLVTPLLNSPAGPERLDPEGLERLIGHVIKGGVHGLFVLGTTGEGPSLSYETRAETIRLTAKFARERIPVLASVSDTSYGETLRLSRVAADAGASAIVIAPPFYFRYPPEDLLAYVRRAVSESPLPVFLYNIPQMTKVGFSVATVKAAAELPKVIGFKDSSHDLGYLAEVIEAVRPRKDFTVLIGPEELLVPALEAGASGGVCGGSNLKPELMVSAFAAFEAGDNRGAAEIQSRIQKMSDAIYTIDDRSTSYLRGLKAALAEAGICHGEMALPLRGFNGGERELLRQRLAKLG